MSRAAYNTVLKAAVTSILQGHRLIALGAIERALPGTIAPPARTTLAKIVIGLGWSRADRPGAALYVAPDQLCDCADCRELDHAHPGEGHQLALPMEARAA